MIVSFCYDRSSNVPNWRRWCRRCRLRARSRLRSRISAAFRTCCRRRRIWSSYGACFIICWCFLDIPLNISGFSLSRTFGFRRISFKNRRIFRRLGSRWYELIFSCCLLSCCDRSDSSLIRVCSAS